MKETKKILLIEDEEDVRMMYDIKFKNGGLNMMEAATGQAGIIMAKKERPDLILLDMKLGEISGLDVLKELKENPKTKKIPVFIFSNAYQKEYETKGKELGAERFILKTKVLPEEMLKIVKERLGV